MHPKPYRHVKASLFDPAYCDADDAEGEDGDDDDADGDADDADGEEAFEIDSEIATTNSIAIDTATTTATGAHFNFPSLTTGTGIDIISGASSFSTDGSLVEIQQTNALGSSANVATLSVQTAGNGAYGVKIKSTHATSNASLRICLLYT